MSYIITVCEINKHGEKDVDYWKLNNKQEALKLAERLRKLTYPQLNLMNAGLPVYYKVDVVKNKTKKRGK